MYIYTYIHIFQGSSTGNNDDDDDGIGVPAAVGITFVVTLIISVTSTLFIVYIVYKVKKTAAKKEIAIGTAMTAVSMPKESTIKVPASSCNDENYEFPDNFVPPKNKARYASNPLTPMQPNPSYGIVQHNETNPVYENLK